MAATDTSCIPKVYYFDGPGKGEVLRLTFAYAGKEFEDIRFSTYTEWTEKFKPLSPLGTAPFYQEGENTIAGSLGIARYVAEKNGLGGSNPIESAQLESYIDAIYDCGSKLYVLSNEPEEKKANAKAEFLKALPGRLQFLEKQVKGENTFLPGRLTYPDLQLSIFHLNCENAQLGEIFKDCPKLLKISSHVDSNKKIKEFRGKHKK